MSNDRINSRQRLFTLVAWSIPLLFFVLLEGCLRVTGFGDDYPLFVELPPKPQYLQPNPDVIKRFFANPAAAPDVSIDTGYFLAEKPAGGLRIVVQGGSSAAGFPYGKNASPAGMLQRRLGNAFPDRSVEVILTAMSAVNSYTLVEFADEIVARQPDAVLIYAGHNEFLGVLGVGSAFGAGHSPALTRFLLRLREWRTWQLLQTAVAALWPAPRARSGTLMAAVAKERSIALDSPLFAAGVEQFRANLDALLSRYAAAGIPVFIGTLASNEKDQPPFMGAPQPQPPGWGSRVAAVSDAIDSGDFAGAQRLGQALVDAAPTAADAHFALGRSQHAAQLLKPARQSYRNAIDHDRLRFRAPTVFEDVIRSAAAKHGATVVEVHRRFAMASEDELIGRELMLEHLHPNDFGFFLLADAFYDALAADGLGLQWRASPDHTAFAQRPLTRIEVLHGNYRVARLMNDWPFTAEKIDYTPPLPASEEERIAQAWYAGQLDYLQAMNHGLVHAQRSGDFEEAARIATNLADAFPFEAQPQHVAGQMLVRMTPPQGERAIGYFRRAAELQPRNVPFLVTLARAYMINGYPDAARATAQRLQQIAPGNEFARQLLETLAEAPAAAR